MTPPVPPDHRPPAERPPGHRGRGRLAPAATAALGVLTAAPGVHLVERWLPRVPAVVVSHGIAVGLLGWAAVQWRARRAREAPREHAPAASARP